jgi:hypothetical protein
MWLQSTLQVVQELRQQQQASAAHDCDLHAAAETLDFAAASVADGKLSNGNTSSPVRALSSTAAGRQHSSKQDHLSSRVASAANRSQDFAESHSSKHISLQQQSSATHLHASKGSASRQCSTGTSQASNQAAAAAARSSLFTPDASRQARAQWLAGKLQQQQLAASALERDLQREQQLLHKLADKKLAAEAAHAQVGRVCARHVSTYDGTCTQTAAGLIVSRWV